MNDTFTVGANTMVEAHTPDIGGAWTRIAGNNGVIINGAADNCRNVNSNDWNVYLNATTPPGAAAEVVVGITVTFTASNANNWVDLVARASNGLMNGYIARVRASNDGTGTNVQIMRVAGGTVSTIASVSVAIGLNAQHAFIFSAKNASKEIWIDGVQRLSSNTNDVAASGVVGFGMNSSAAGQSIADDLFAKTVASTTTSVATSGTPSSDGTSVTFTAIVTGGVSGTVTFKDGLTTLGTVTPDAGGTAQYATSALGVGSHSITAVYNSGDPNHAGSTSAAITQMVNGPDPTVTAGDTIGYTELQPSPPAIDSTLTVTDGNSPTLAGATVTISGGFFAGDTVSVTNQFGITGTYDSATHRLTLTGTDTLANYQTALRSVSFSSSSNNPDNFGTDTSRTITWQVDDGAASNNLSNAATSTINITTVNDPPGIDLDADNSSGAPGNDFAALYASGGSAVAVADTDVSPVDPDNTTLASATIAIANHQANDLLSVNGALPGNIVASPYNAASGVLTLSSAGATATLAQWQAALPQIVFSNASAAPSVTTRDITVVVNDGLADSNTAHAFITICLGNPVVTDPGDSGPGTLRQAIADACGTGVITFNLGTGPHTIDLTSGELLLNKNLTVTGPGASLLTVQHTSGSNFRIFHVTPGTIVTIDGLTIANGRMGLGGGIFNDRGTLTVVNSALSGNVASYGGAVYSEALTGAASLTIVNSTLSGNSAFHDGGALGNLGTTGSTATVALTNVTITGNTSTENGGGIANLGETPTSAVTITNGTITNNRADSDTSGGETGGGLFNSSLGTVTLRNTIVARNFVGGSGTTADDITGALDTATSSNNLIGDATNMTGVTNGSNGNQVGTSGSPIDPRLGPLADNGGPTQTHALLAGSPALDAGDNTFVTGTTDQRGTGFARIRDAADADTTATVDIGAFEADPVVEDITDKTTNEDTPLSFTFNVGDSTAGPAFDPFTATSSNTTLVPNAPANLTVTGSGSTRTMNITPALNQFGTATITVTVTKTIGGTVVSMSDTFVLMVNPVGDTPSVTNATTVANVQTTSGLVISRNAADGAEIGFFKITGITNGTLFQNDGTTPIANTDVITFAQGNAGLRFTPATGGTATGSFQVQASVDAIGTGLSSGFATATITVNAHATTTTIVSDQPDPSDPSVPVTVVYTVVSADGGPTPTGTVTVTASGGSETCSGTVAAGQCAITLTVAGVNRTLTASYGGDAVNAIGADTALHTVRSCPATPVVTTTADGGAGSLRQAITDACGTDTITFNLGAGPHSIGLTSGELLLDKNLTITGPGATLLTVQRASGSPFRIFHVSPDMTVTISGLTISHGRSMFGGGIQNDQGHLTIANSTLSGNISSHGGAIYSHSATIAASLTIVNSTLSGNLAGSTGGAIANIGTGAAATLTIVDSTLSANTAGSIGGAIYNSAQNTGAAALTVTNVAITGNNAASNGGGIYNYGVAATLAVTNSTISGNTANQSGGGIASEGDVGTTTQQVTVTNATITNNRMAVDPDFCSLHICINGGGLAVGASTVTLRNTIVAGNYFGASPATAADDIWGPLDTPTSFNNLIGDGTNMAGVTNGSQGNQVGTPGSPIDPKLGPLANNGGPTQTHALLLGSPALDAGDNTFVTGTTDQRGTGFGRIRDAADPDTTATVDIGAFEADPVVEDITDKTTNEDTPLSFTFNVGDSTAGPAFDPFTATSSNTTLVPNAPANLTVTGSGSTRTLTITPALNQFGTATITVTVTKTIGGTVVSMSDTFVLTVNPVNDAPTLDPISNPAAILEDAGLQTVNLTGITAGGGESQNLTVTAVSNNPALIPNPTVSYTSPNATGSLTYTPVADANGSAIVTVTVMDDGGGTNTFSRTFTVNVTPVNDPPTLNAIPDPAAILEDAPLQTVNLTGISPGGGETQTLTVTASSNNTGLIPNPTVTYTSPNAVGSLSYTPVANANGFAVITVTVDDGGPGTHTVTRTFTVNVTPVNDRPTIGNLPDQQMPAGTSLAIPVTVGDIETAPSALVVTATSSNQTVVPNAGLVVSAGGTSRTLTLTPAPNQTGAATITVTVDDGTGGQASDKFVVTVVPALSIADATIVEGHSGTTNLSFTVSLAGSSTSTVSVNYTTRQRTAIAGVDYITVAGTVSFAPGATTATILVPVVGDTQTEIDETFYVDLSGPLGAAITGAEAVGTITNDDPTSPVTAEFVTWGRRTGVTPDGGTLTKTAGIGWTAGASATRAIKTGDGSLEFSAATPHQRAAVGLSRSLSPFLIATDIDFGIHLFEDATFAVVEHGVNVTGPLGTYASGDRFAIAVTGGVLEYQRNGVTVYTSAGTPVYPLRVDAAIFTPGATIADVVLAGRLTRLAGAAGDFDNDGKSDLTVFRPSTGGWHTLQSSTNYTTSASVAWGLSTDVQVAGDYDGDGKTDPAIFRPSTGLWAILKSSTNYTTSMTVSWGVSTDLPVAADYDGDGRIDPAVYRPSTGGWYVLKSSTNYTSSIAVSWGLSTDRPLPADYDGDGQADPAIFRPSTGLWAILKSSTGYGSSMTVSWGLSTDVAVPGDYDGDGKSDPAVYRPSTGGWYILKSSTNYGSSIDVLWGLSTDIPVPADYDGDGRYDPAVFRPSTGGWYVLKSSTNYTASFGVLWGVSTDVAVNRRP